ncbi:MAG: lytic transglycosylase domain-containing protein [Betaproteobacteria bacterium]|nr:lytic transglycosylase domain-containing protein [Betaproteobacteria bacterium]
MLRDTITPIRRVLTAVLTLLPLLALAAKGPSPEEAVRAARDAYRAGNAAKLAKAAASLNGHVLAPYGEYWQLSPKLDGAQPGDVRAFLDRNAGTFLAEQLRREWLQVLGRKEQWELFREELPLLANDDAPVRCYALLARWRQGDESALAELKRLWDAPREFPEGCGRLAREAIAAGQVSEDQVWERFRLLAESSVSGAARFLFHALPSGRVPEARQLERIAAAPAAYLDRAAEPKGRVARELAILALTRLAKSDPKLAAGYWGSRLRIRFSTGDQAWVWAQLATNAAKRHLPEALAWFREAEKSALSDEQLAWRARIALRQQNWAEVQKAVANMSPLVRSDPTWIYWEGRSNQALGVIDEAWLLFARIAGEANFYGQLAGEELGILTKLPPKAASPTPGEVAEIARHPGLERALALHRAGLRAEAIREWNWSIRGMDDRSLLAAAELARRHEVWDRAINTADKTVALHDFSLRYLAPYREILAGEARSRSLEEPWVLGLVRQESRFIANAKSSAGASGLMQLMPATARWIAAKLGLKNYSWSRVTEVDVNARLGTAYLKRVLDDLGGHPVLAAAAYNAGPGRARKWRDAQPLEGAVYAESIPFPETRDYVKKVMTNTLYYAALAGAPKRTLKERLGIVAARPAGERVAALAEEARR